MSWATERFPKFNNKTISPIRGKSRADPIYSRTGYGPVRVRRNSEIFQWKSCKLVVCALLSANYSQKTHNRLYYHGSILALYVRVSFVCVRARAISIGPPFEQTRTAVGRNIAFRVVSGFWLICFCKSNDTFGAALPHRGHLTRFIYFLNKFILCVIMLLRTHSTHCWLLAAAWWCWYLGINTRIIFHVQFNRITDERRMDASEWLPLPPPLLPLHTFFPPDPPPAHPTYNLQLWRLKPEYF